MRRLTRSQAPCATHCYEAQGAVGRGGEAGAVVAGTVGAGGAVAGVANADWGVGGGGGVAVTGTAVAGVPVAGVPVAGEVGLTGEVAVGGVAGAPAGGVGKLNGGGAAGAPVVIGGATAVRVGRAAAPAAWALARAWSVCAASSSSRVGFKVLSFNRSTVCCDASRSSGT